jgi:hypothetical protein
MDAIDLTKNCVTTECGHQFHAKCLMQNVAHNGFDCPYCRAAMAEEVSDEDSDFTDSTVEEVSELYSDRSLYAMRQLFRMNSDEGEEEEVEDDSWSDEDDDEEGEQNENAIPVQLVVEKMQQHFTYEQLIRIILQNQNFDYQNPANSSDRDEFRMYERFHRDLENVIDSYYADEAAVAPINQVEPVSVPVPNPVANNTFYHFV